MRQLLGSPPFLLSFHRILSFILSCPPSRTFAVLVPAMSVCIHCRMGVGGGYVCVSIYVCEWPRPDMFDFIHQVALLVPLSPTSAMTSRSPSLTLIPHALLPGTRTSCPSTSLVLRRLSLIAVARTFSSPLMLMVPSMKPILSLSR